jgi:hypothetical protein
VAFAVLFLFWLKREEKPKGLNFVASLSDDFTLLVNWRYKGKDEFPENITGRNVGTSVFILLALSHFIWQSGERTGGERMEVDDIEQNLLQQFSCMGTTDHDVLISQLRKLVGDDVNETTASFFLDMNNW